MTLVLKLVLTPLLIAAASLAGRRWGAGDRRLAGRAAAHAVALAAAWAAFAVAAAALQVLLAVLLGLFSFAAFFVVLGALPERLGTAGAFVAATVVALAAQAVSLASSTLGRT